MLRPHIGSPCPPYATELCYMGALSAVACRGIWSVAGQTAGIWLCDWWIRSKWEPPAKPISYMKSFGSICGVAPPTFCNLGQGEQRNSPQGPLHKAHYCIWPV